MSDRLLRLLRDAARGNPPPADGVVEVWPGPPGPVDAVLAFTAHHVVAAGVDPGPGRLLAEAGRCLTPRGEPLFAQVAPGNAASLRVVGAAGFRPLGAEGLFHRGHAEPTYRSLGVGLTASLGRRTSDEGGDGQGSEP